MTSLITGDLETLQNNKNSLAAAAAARNSFFSRKIHKLKKMLRPLFCRPRHRPAPAPVPWGRCDGEGEDEDEELQNRLNEELEARLAADLAQSPVSGDAIRALEAGRATLVLVHPGTPVPASFFTPTPGRFSWTFLPAPDQDICSRGDSALSLSQVPEQQTPPASPR